MPNNLIRLLALVILLFDQGSSELTTSWKDKNKVQVVRQGQFYSKRKLCNNVKNIVSAVPDMTADKRVTAT